MDCPKRVALHPQRFNVALCPTTGYVAIIATRRSTCDFLCTQSNQIHFQRLGARKRGLGLSEGMTADVVRIFPQTSQEWLIKQKLTVWINRTVEE
jgi:hypothetical protein